MKENKTKQNSKRNNKQTNKTIKTVVTVCYIEWPYYNVSASLSVARDYIVKQ